MDTYRVLADGMTKKAANINNTAESIFSSQQAITKLVNSLTKDDFNGQLPEMMKQKVVGLEEKYNRLNETLTNYSRAITAAANTYVATDQAIARWADELGVDDASIRGGGTVAPGDSVSGKPDGSTLASPEGNFSTSASWEMPAVNGLMMPNMTTGCIQTLANHRTVSMIWLRVATSRLSQWL